MVPFSLGLSCSVPTSSSSGCVGQAWCSVVEVGTGSSRSSSSEMWNGESLTLATRGAWDSAANAPDASVTVTVAIGHHATTTSSDGSVGSKLYTNVNGAPSPFACMRSLSMNMAGTGARSKAFTSCQRARTTSYLELKNLTTTILDTSSILQDTTPPFRAFTVQYTRSRTA